MLPSEGRSRRFESCQARHIPAPARPSRSARRALRLAVLLCLLLPAAAPGDAGLQELQAAHVIDWHVHTAGLGYGGSGNFINDAMRDNIRFSFYLRWMGVDLETLENRGDQLVVQRIHEQVAASRLVDAAVVLALDGVIDAESGQLDRRRTQVYVPNRFVAEQTARYDNLLFGASINPERPDAAARLIEVCRQGAWLVKWLPAIMHINPANPRYIPFYDTLARLDLPLLVHVGREDAFAEADNSLADPRRLQLPLQRGVTVIAAHLAAGGRSAGEANFQRLLPMFRDYPNLYADISALTLINKRGYLVRALQVPGLEERLIYGTDWPLQYWPAASPWYHLRYLGLGRTWRLARVQNAWDRDVRVKRALGAPLQVFRRRLGRSARGLGGGMPRGGMQCVQQGAEHSPDGLQ